MTKRIERIREDYIAAKPTLCSQRAVLVTEAYKKNEWRSAPIKRAVVLYDLLDKMDIVINRDELIVGNHALKGLRSTPVFPEWGAYWLERELDELETRSQDRFIVSEKVKEDLRRIFPYWKGKTVYDRIWGELPTDVKKARENYIFTLDVFERGGLGHLIYDIPGILKKGFKGIKKEIQENLNNIDKVDPNISNPENYKKSLFWRAALITSDAVINFAHRFSKLSKSEAKKTEDKQRKEELLTISEICNRIPENPANSFWEAIQTIWFIHLVIQLETNGTAISIGRLDQYLYPYFKKDIENNRLTLEQAQELIDSLWLKLNGIIKVWDTEATRVHAGFPMTQNVIIGGENEDGEDVTNELTYMMLTAQEHIRLEQPQFTMRVHKNTPKDLMLRAAEIIRIGTGMPALFGDEIIIPALINMGIPLKEARNYAMVGCNELCVIGAYPRSNGGYINLVRIVDLAINNGVDRLTGKKVGISTETSEGLKSFNDVLRAIRKQMEYFIKLNAIENNIIEYIQAEMTPHIFASSVIPGCIQKGKDLTEGGALYNWTPPIGAGTATVADSLAAIKKFVYDENKISLRELNEVLNNNFAGTKGAEIRKLLQTAPKYGNDLVYVDCLAKKVTDIFFNEVEKYKTQRGGKFTSMLLSLAVTVPFGWTTGATADGRLAKTPISDSISPVNGADTNGPTAVLKSASKLDQVRTAGGNILNLKFNKTVLENKDSLSKFSQLLRTYLVDLKGLEVQVNVLSGKTLREAQKTPEKYRNLIIRVAGYSARFVELAEEIQNDIIRRTEHQTV